MLTLDVPDDVVPLLREAIEDLVSWYRQQAPKSPGVCYGVSADRLIEFLAQFPGDE